MIKLLNKKTNTAYVLSDATATKWLKENPELWVAIKAGVQKGEPARKLEQNVVDKIVANNETIKEDIANEDEPIVEEPNKSTSLDEMNYVQLKALATRIGCKPKGNVSREKLIEAIKAGMGK